MTVSAMTPTEKLPVSVLEHPHWRVNFRPSVYVSNRLESLSACISVLHKASVKLRGWDFPYVPSRASELGYGDTWVAGWSDFMGHVDYWRFYQSTQFLHLAAVREVTDPEWEPKLRRELKSYVGSTIDIDAVPGFLSLTNSIYNITEYFEFAARLAQAEIYIDPITIAISVKGVNGFMLVAEPPQMWRSSEYVTRDAELNYVQTFAPADLISSAAEHAVACTLWLFERFGWLKPNVDAIRTDQQKLLARRF